MKRNIVVTGSASGIGAATVEVLRARGATVIGVDLKEAEVTGDLSTDDGRALIADEIVNLSEGSIDGVVACAGIAAGTARTVAINYFGVTDLLERLLPTLQASPAPRVAIVSSVSAVGETSSELVGALLDKDPIDAMAIAEELARTEVGSALIYPSSKRAVARWARRHAITEGWAGHGIALNAVAPGTVMTPMMAEAIADDNMRALVDRVVPMPLNYHQPPESIGKLLAWLTSEENTHMTGQLLFCDGGAEASLRGGDIPG